MTIHPYTFLYSILTTIYQRIQNIFVFLRLVYLSKHMVFSCIHFVTNNRIFFAMQNFVMYLYHVLFVQLSAGKHLNLFHILAVMNMGHKLFFNILILFHLDKFPEVGWMGHMQIYFQVYEGSIRSSIIVVLVQISTNDGLGYLSTHSLACLFSFFFFNF